jgi:serine/threonine protein phosphatase PrpC
VISLRAGSATDVGRVRSNNQDSFLVAPPLYAVADGMGGAAAGEVASAVAIGALNEVFAAGGDPTSDLLLEASQAANRAVWEQAEANPEMRGMGTTLVAVALVEGERLAVANVGDSRLYAFHAGELRQVTFDHNLVAEMVAEGRLSKEEAEFHPRRNIMTRALGVEPEVPVDLFIEEARPGDRFVLCSDGLPRDVNDAVISAVLRRLSDPSEAAKELVDEAMRRGGNDNITVVVVDVVGDSEAAAAGDEAADADATVVAPVAEPAAAPPEEAPRRRLGRRKPTTAAPQSRPVNLRVVAFILLLLLILGGGAAGVAWYARAAYFVGLSGAKIVIFQGRPGGVLWLHPTVSEVTTYTTADVLPYRVNALRAGQPEPSLSAAKSYVQALVQEQRQTQVTLPPATTTPSTT